MDTILVEHGWYKRCKQMLEWKPVPSKARFIESVMGQIAANPKVFPTVRQADVLMKIWTHLSKRNPSEAELLVLEALGFKSCNASLS